MKSFTLFALVTSFGAVYTAPLVGRDASPEDQTLNLALALEHLVGALYEQGLGRFDAEAFTDAALPPFTRGRVSQIAEHGLAHIQILLAVLENKAVKPCEYSFDFDDAADFVVLGSILEGITAAAYLGASKSFVEKKVDPVVLSTAGSILVNKGRHQAWLQSAVLKQQPWSGPFETALDPNQVFTLASAFIKSCPEGNADLGLKLVPPLTLDPASPEAGQTVTLSFDGVSADGPKFLALHKGSTPEFIPIENNQATLPEGLQGTIYALITKDKEVTDASTLAGPVALNFHFDSAASNPL